MNVTDYCIAGVIIVSTFISLLRGLFKELLSLVVWAVGFWLAIKMHAHAAALLKPYITNDIICQILGFLGLFFLVLIVGALVSSILSLIITKSGLSGTDRLLGMVFGSARGVLLVAVVLLMLSLTSFVQDSWWQGSKLVPHFSVLIDWLKGFLPQRIDSIANILPKI